MNSFQPSISNHRNGKVFVAVLDGTYQRHQRMFRKVFRGKYEFSIHVCTYEGLSLLYCESFQFKTGTQQIKKLYVSKYTN
jgi:hypothetical protein